jgi:hypothetical protein
MWLFSIAGSWGSAAAALHPRAGSPAEHLGWGARLYAAATLRGLRVVNARLSTLCAKGCARGDPGPLAVLIRLADYLFARFLLGTGLVFFVAVGR